MPEIYYTLCEPSRVNLRYSTCIRSLNRNLSPLDHNVPFPSQDVYIIVMEYLTSEHYSLLNTADDISVWMLSDIKVGCVEASAEFQLLSMAQLEFGWGLHTMLLHAACVLLVCHWPSGLVVRASDWYSASVITELPSCVCVHTMLSSIMRGFYQQCGHNVIEQRLSIIH